MAKAWSRCGEHGEGMVKPGGARRRKGKAELIFSQHGKGGAGSGAVRQRRGRDGWALNRKGIDLLGTAKAKLGTAL